MKRKQLLNIIGDIKDDYIAEAASNMPNKKSHVWTKRLAIAACFALVFAAGIPVINHILVGPDSKMVESILLVEYNNAYYEVIENNPQYLERKGIETEITKDLAGKHITYLKKENEAKRSNYIVSLKETNIELLEYLPAKQEAVKILRDGDHYFAVVFCNYLIPDNESLPFDENFKVYGITKAEDIKKIVPVKTDNEYKAIGTAVTDPTFIAAFYNEILTLEQYSEDEFDSIQFTYEDESNADEYYGQFADDRNDFMIETVDGLRFIINYFPTYDWVRCNLTQTYYKLSPALKTWIETNFTR